MLKFNEENIAIQKNLQASAANASAASTSKGKPGVGGSAAGGSASVRGGDGRGGAAGRKDGRGTKRGREEVGFQLLSLISSPSIILLSRRDMHNKQDARTLPFSATGYLPVLCRFQKS